MLFAFADGRFRPVRRDPAAPIHSRRLRRQAGQRRRLAVASSAAAIPGIDLILITDRPQIDRVRDLVVAANGKQMADAAFVRELKAWLRFSPREATQSGDGLFSASSGTPALPACLGPRVFDWVFKTNAENDKYARQIASSAGVAVFVSKRDDREH